MAQDMQLTLKLNADGSAMVSGLKRVEKQTHRCITKASGLSHAYEILKNNIMLFGSVAYSAMKVINLADSLKQMNARVRMATKTQDAYANAMAASVRIAKEARSDYQSTVYLFSRLTTAADQYGISQDKITQTTEAVTYGLKLYGASAQEVASVQLQLSQAMASGVLAGDEFRSMAEASPRLMQALADGLGVARGELKKMGSDGKLTTKVVVEALAKQSAVLKEEFQNMPTTVGEALGQVRNNLVQTLESLDQNSHATEIISSVILLLNKVLRELAIGLFSLITGWLALIVVQKAYSTLVFLKSIPALVRLEMSLGGVGRGAGIAAAAFKVFMHSNNLLIRSIRFLTLAIAANPLGLIAVAVSSIISYLVMFRNEIHPVSNSIATLSDYVVVAFRFIKNAILSIIPSFESIKSMWNSVTETLGAKFKVALNTILNGFKWLLNNLKQAINRFIGMFIGSYKAIVAIFSDFPNALNGIMLDAINWALKAINYFVQGAAKLLNKLPGVDIEIDTLGFDMLENKAKKSSQAVRDAFYEGFNYDYVGKYFDLWGESFDLVANGMEQIGSSWKQAAELEHINSQANTDEPKESTDPMLSGLSSQANSTTSALKSVQEQLQAIADFKKSQTDKLSDYEFETSLIGLQAQEVERLRFEHELNNQAQQAIAGLSQANANAILQETMAIKEKQQALVAQRQIAQQAQGNNIAGGLKAGFDEAVKSAGTAYSTMEKISNQATNSMADGITNMVMTGKGSFSDLAKSILADITRMIIKFLILKAIGAAMGMFSEGGAFNSGGEMALAKGGAFNSKGVKYYARGGIFNSPTAFAHAGGLGVMGEAGPEAVMPLTRGANGKLGVAVYNSQKASDNRALGQVNNIDINVSIAGGETNSNISSSKEEGRDLAEKLEFVVRSVLLKELRPGGMLNAS